MNGSKKISFSSLLSKYGIYFAFVVLCIALSIISPSFLSVKNLMNVFRQASIIGIVAVGVTFVIITGGIDLSVGSLLALSAVIACSFATIDKGLILVIPILIGLIVGTAGGLFNGVMVARFKLAPFIVTLAMMTIARGLTLVYTNGRPVINLSDGYKVIGGGYFLGIPIPVIIFVVMIVASHFLLKFTKFGRYVYAVGGNERAAVVSGVNVSLIKIVCYGIAGLTSAISGIVLSSRVMTGQPVMGAGYELDAIAAVVIGGTSLSGGAGGVLGTLVGVMLIGVMNNGLDLLNVSPYYQQVVKGVIIMLAVLMDRKKN